MSEAEPRDQSHADFFLSTDFALMEIPAEWTTVTLKNTSF